MRHEPRQRVLADRLEFGASRLEWIDGIEEAAEEVALGVVYAESDLEDLELAVFDGVVASLDRDATIDEDAVWGICRDVVRDVWQDVKGRIALHALESD